MSIEQTIPVSRRGLVARYLARFEEDRLVRAIFFGMLIGTATVLGFDLSRLAEENELFARPQQASTAVTVQPSAATTTVRRGGGRDPRRAVGSGEAALREPIRFVLKAGGLLQATGTIEPGAAQRFAGEVAAQGGRIRTVSLDSPGGSLDDAMAMARLIRRNGIATEVADGAICASSCPLVLAGGVERHVGAGAAIGLHQFYAVTRGAGGPAQAMADAQMTTARISRLLIELGIDPALWLHALDTPPRSLYYLSADQMKAYRLTTGGDRLALRGS